MKINMRPGGMIFRFGIAALAATAACTVCRAQTAVELPNGVKAVWDMSKAYVEKTPTRERFCINGLWRWQPATDASPTASVPTSNWGYFKVPGSWPGNYDGFMRHDSQTLYVHPAWKDVNVGNLTAAWYQREISIPIDWSWLRRIELSTEYLYSFAAVYVDGKQVGEMRFPAGSVNLDGVMPPGTTHTLSMLVIALPLSATMISNSDTAMAKQVKGVVERCGLCGDVWLSSKPQGPSLGDVKVETSVRKWEITFDAGIDGPDTAGPYCLRAEVSAEGLPTREFTSKLFTMGDLNANGRFAFTAEWKPEKLWDTDTPQNLYKATLTLLGREGVIDTRFPPPKPIAKGEPGAPWALDIFPPVRFGFREFWINGRDFYLNGNRITVSAEQMQNAAIGPGSATYDAAKETFLRLQSCGCNFVFGGNYGCAPGVHLSFEEILRAADDVGMLVALSQPHDRQYTWTGTDADNNNGYAPLAQFYTHVAGNHPSVIAYAMSHNGWSYVEFHNPDLIDGIKDPRYWTQQRDAAQALEAEAIVKHYDTSRVIYHHSCGDLGSTYTMNFYPNFTPMQELDDWFTHWSTAGVKPLYVCEYAAPFTWDFAMYRGWFDGRRNYGSAAVPWELCLAQWNAQFYGDSAFQPDPAEEKDLRWESAHFRAGDGWRRWDYPYELGSTKMPAQFPTIGAHITDNLRAFRTLGVCGEMWDDHDYYWELRDGVDKSRKELKVDWDHLQQPGYSPDYIGGQQDSMELGYARSDWTPNPAGQALLRNNMPLLAYIGGKPEAFSSKDHNFIPGETVHKQLILINNSRVEVTYDSDWALTLPGAAAGGKKGAVASGEQERIPIRFALPADVTPGRYVLSATVRFGSGETQKDSFEVNVLPQPQPVPTGPKIALFDPKGETAKLLDALKAPYQTVDAKAGLSGYDILVIGKEALTVDGPAPDITRVRDGLRVVMFEQTSEVMQNRLGFRTEEYGLRQVFKRVPDSPLLAGLDTENLHDWRGDATLLPPRLTYHMGYEDTTPAVYWCGIEVARIWRCGCRGNVASVLIEKPACGNFMPILDGGYSLQYSPLTVYSEGKGMVLFCQMDVTGRTETDPAAQTLAANILRYAVTWKPGETNRKVVYVGDPAGDLHLRHSGLVPTPYNGGRLSPDDVLVVGTGGGKKLADHAESVAAFLKAGGNVLALGLDEEEARTVLPTVSMKKQEHITAFFDPFGEKSLLAGIGPADVFNAGATEITLVSGGATAYGDGVLAKAPDENLVFAQLPPYSITAAEGAVQSVQVDSGDAADGKRSALLVAGTTTLGRGLLFGQRSDAFVLPGQPPGAPNHANWAPQVGKMYTFAVLIKPLSGPVAVYQEIERYGSPWDRALRRTPDTVLPPGKWTDLHVTFKCDKPYPEGWSAYIGCTQDGAVFRADMFRLYDGEYIPWKPGSEGTAQAPVNLIANPSFESGAIQPYWVQYTEQYNLRRGYRRASVLMTRALANMCVACPTPLLSRVSTPVAIADKDKPERRWTQGLYVDQVEEWDDPYRFFCW